MKRQNTQRSLSNFKLQYLHLVVKSSKYIFGGTHCGVPSGTSEGTVDGSADGYDINFDIGYDEGFDDGYDAALGV